MLECVSREIASAGYIVGLTLGDGRRMHASMVTAFSASMVTAVIASDGDGLWCVGW